MLTEFEVVLVGDIPILEQEDEFVLTPVKRAHARAVLYPDAEVLELGVLGTPSREDFRRVGAAAIAEMVQPDLGLITNIGKAHIEYFESIENVSETKSALFTTLPRNGKALINLDDPLISKMEVSCSQVSYSFNTSADFLGCWTKLHQFDELRVNGTPITIPVPSEAFGKNALAVFAAASQFDIPTEKALPLH